MISVPHLVVAGALGAAVGARGRLVGAALGEEVVVVVVEVEVVVKVAVEVMVVIKVDVLPLPDEFNRLLVSLCLRLVD